MKRWMTQLTFAGAFALAGGCAMVPRQRPVVSSAAGDPVRGKFLVNVNEQGVALEGGHDPVAFFTQHKPVMGDPQYQSAYKGAVYYFASAENKATFETNPAQYEPQFGGYCGYAASINRISPISVAYFEILDGRLVLQHNRKAWDLWHQDVPANLKKADHNWPDLVAHNGM